MGPKFDFPQKILLAIDGSLFAAAAVNLLTHIAWPVGTVTRVLAVASERPPFPDLSPLSRRAADKTIIGIHPWDRTTLQTLTAQVVKRLRAAHLNVEAEVFAGQPGPMILERAEKLATNLIVVGAKGLNASDAVRLGSTAERLAYESGYSVLIARPTEHIRPLSIVLVIDDLVAARQACEFLCTLSLPDWAQVTVVSVIQDSVTMPAYRQMSAAGWSTPFEAEARAAEVVDRLHQSGAQGRIAVRVGRPADEILAVARERDAALIVLGAGEQDRLEPHRLSSVVRKVIKDSPSSVLVVR